MRRGSISELESRGLAILADDLTVLVDRLQADWADGRKVRPATVQELHDLRERAERLLFKFG